MSDGTDGPGVNLVDLMLPMLLWCLSDDFQEGNPFGSDGNYDREQIAEALDLAGERISILRDRLEEQQGLVRGYEASLEKAHKLLGAEGQSGSAVALVKHALSRSRVTSSKMSAAKSALAKLEEYSVRGNSLSPAAARGYAKRVEELLSQLHTSL